MQYAMAQKTCVRVRQAAVRLFLPLESFANQGRYLVESYANQGHSHLPARYLLSGSM